MAMWIRNGSGDRNWGLGDEELMWVHTAGRRHAELCCITSLKVMDVLYLCSYVKYKFELQLRCK